MLHYEKLFINNKKFLAKKKRIFISLVLFCTARTKLPTNFNSFSNGITKMHVIKTNRDRFSALSFRLHCLREEALRRLETTGLVWFIKEILILKQLFLYFRKLILENEISFNPVWFVIMWYYAYFLMQKIPHCVYVNLLILVPFMNLTIKNFCIKEKARN